MEVYEQQLRGWFPHWKCMELTEASGGYRLSYSSSEIEDERTIMDISARKIGLNITAIRFSDLC